MFRMFARNRLALLPALFVLVFAVSVFIPQALYAAATPRVPALAFIGAPAAQPIPDPNNSYIPVILQTALIVLIAQGVKSLGKALFGTDAQGNPKFNLDGRAAAIAYIIVGLLVYGYGIFITALPPDAATQVNSFVGVAATLLAGSGLFSMTAVFRA